eukprot:5004691-Prymnesium_polylepis.1
MVTVRTIGYAEIMRLWKKDFEEVVKMFPALRVHMLGVQRELKEKWKTEQARTNFNKTKAGARGALFAT